VRRKPSAKRCPKCSRSDAVRPIVYGYPAPETMKAEGRGSIVLGGCIVGDIDPTYACLRCRIRFDFQRPELARGKVAQRGWVEDDEGPGVA
jgi:hypothetical protein